jgi:hypothetical protein
MPTLGPDTRPTNASNVASLVTAVTSGLSGPGFSSSNQAGPRNLWAINNANSLGTIPEADCNEARRQLTVSGIFNAALPS